MFMILSIVHGSTHRLPLELTFHEIEGIAHVAHRYDLNHVLIGYLDKWLEPHLPSLLEIDYEDWLYVAWQFGLEDQYLTLANYLAVNCEINSQNELLVPSTSACRLLPDMFPPHTIFLIHTCRVTALDNILFTIRAWIEEALTLNTCKHPCDLQEQAMCTARNSHGLLRYLMQHDLFPMLGDTARETRSVRRIFEIMTSADLRDALRVGGTNNEHEAACSLAKPIGEGMQCLAEQLPWAVDNDLLNAIRRNGASRGEPLSETNVPARLVGLGEVLGLRDEMKEEVEAEVKIEINEEPMLE
ncbi:hypothetical protein DE146DRAFT_519923 [Phaeosphaeria sp. MPI-PUGE-AT-0046c]|nr:hypothetical protein DE146DRAFT_519923 [Phaeosphaeria sp. MPI-PUGE-AT-0046c]